MKAPHNNLLSILTAGLLEGAFHNPQGRCVIDLKEWSKDPDHKPLLMAQAIRNTLYQIERANGETLEPLLRGRTLSEVLTPELKNCHGLRRELTPLLNRAGFANPEEANYMATKEAFFTSAMKLSLDGKFYLVFMALPCELSSPQLEQLEHFETLLVRLTPMVDDWSYAIHFNPSMPAGAPNRNRKMRHTARRIREAA